jgi:phosphate starvation-inducible PhoH-like protein
MYQLRQVPLQTRSDKVEFASRISYCPRNAKQDLYIRKLEMQNRVVVGFGAKGTEKTLLALQVGVYKLMRNQVSKIIVTHGDDKQNHSWIFPMWDILQYYYTRTELQDMLDRGIIEFAPLAHLHNRHFDNTWLMCDEAQHLSKIQTTVMLTQLGTNTKIIFTANPLLPDQDDSESGLNNFIDLINSSDKDFSDTISIVEFDDIDAFNFQSASSA